MVNKTNLSKILAVVVLINLANPVRTMQSDQQKQLIVKQSELTDSTTTKVDEQELQNKPWEKFGLRVIKNYINGAMCKYFAYLYAQEEIPFDKTDPRYKEFINKKLVKNNNKTLSIYRSEPEVEILELVKNDETPSEQKMQFSGNVCFGYIEYMFRNYGDDKYMNICKLQIGKSAEGRGLGSMLVKFAIDEAKKHQCSFIELYPRADFQDTPSQTRQKRLEGFYKMLGFKNKENGFMKLQLS